MQAHNAAQASKPPLPKNKDGDTSQSQTGVQKKDLKEVNNFKQGKFGFLMRDTPVTKSQSKPFEYHSNSDEFQANGTAIYELNVGRGTPAA